MSIAFNGMPIGVTASSKIILLTNIILILFYTPHTLHPPLRVLLEDNLTTPDGQDSIPDRDPRPVQQDSQTPLFPQHLLPQPRCLLNETQVQDS